MAIIYVIYGKNLNHIFNVSATKFIKKSLNFYDNSGKKFETYSGFINKN